VSARLLAAGLAATALLLDAAGVHSLGALAVVAAVPASGIAALYALDDAIARPCLSRSVVVALAALAPLLVLVAAVVRPPAVPAADLPALGVTALVAALLVFALQAVVAAASLALRRPRRRLVTLSH
jgi:hypothetical protein